MGSEEIDKTQAASDCTEMNRKLDKILISASSVVITCADLGVFQCSLIPLSVTHTLSSECHSETILSMSVSDIIQAS